MASFTEEEDDFLIELIIKNPPIYDSRLKSYKDNIVRENIFEHIAKKLNKTSDDCKKRWKCIRDLYNRIKRKNKLPTGSAAGCKSKNWPLLNRLSFLEKIPAERKSLSNLDTPDDTDESENAVTNDENCYNIEDAKNKENPSKTEKNGNERSETVVISETEGEKTADNDKQDKSSKPSTGGVNKKKKQSQNSAIQMALLQYWKERDSERRAQIQALTSQANSPLEQEQDVDGIMSFCSHVGTMLRKLTPALRVQAKTKVFNILADYELMSLNQTSSDSSNSPLFNKNYQSSSSNPYSPISSPSPVQATDLNNSNTFNFPTANLPVQATNLSTTSNMFNQGTDLSNSSTFNFPTTQSPVQATNLSTSNIFNLQSNYYENMPNTYNEQTDINNSNSYLP